MPIILRAVSNNDSIGHAFIADRYKRIIGTMTNCYEWVFDSSMSSTIVPYVPERIETEIILDSDEIGINWGWENSNINSTDWYSLTGDWIVDNLGQVNFCNNRCMISNFQVIH